MSEHALERNGNIINRKYTEYFLPTVLTALANNIAIIVDSIIVGNMLSSTSMTAINLLSPVTQFYFSITILFGLGASTLISFAKGKNDKKGADRAFTVAAVLLVFLIVVFMIVQFLFLDRIARVLTEIPELNSELRKYYIPFIAGTPLSLLLPSMVHCIRSDARPKFASNLIIISNVINLIMDIVLMGPCQMGIMGSSIATVIGNFVAFVIMLTHFGNSMNTLAFDFSVLKAPKEFFGEFVSLFTTGISGALGTLLITLKMFYLNTMIQNAGGRNAMVAMSVISMCEVFVSAFVTGASQTMIPIVSVLLGERDNTGIKYAFKRAVSVLISASLAIALMVEAFPQVAAKLFGESDPAGLAVVVPALRTCALSFPALALTFLFMYYFTATKKKSMSLTVSIVDGLVFIIPCTYILNMLFGINGIWVAYVLARYGTWIVIAAMIVAAIKRSKGRYKDLYMLNDDVNELMSLSVNSDIPMEEILSYVTEKLDGTDTQNKEKIMAALSEILACINATEENKSVLTDIRINHEENNYIILLRSNGSLSDALEIKKKIYKNFEHASVLGMNQIKAVI